VFHRYLLPSDVDLTGSASVNRAQGCASISGCSTEEVL
jgi:hypothetical protein